jgi:hypothetical protein
VFPPVRPELGVDYVLLTDDPSLRVKNWRTQLVDPHGLRGNRRYKMIGHRDLGEYDASIYVDGNIRILGSLHDFASRFLRTGAALGVYRHPVRTTVQEEIEACERAHKVEDAGSMHREFAEYRADGFEDGVALIESGVVIKNHAHPALEPAMDLWWSLFDRHRTRDQISLPYVIWKSALPCYYIDESYKLANPWFGFYPHAGGHGVPARYAWLAGRSYDSAAHRAALRVWEAKWWLQRRLRALSR